MQFFISLQDRFVFEKLVQKYGSRLLIVFLNSQKSFFFNENLTPTTRFVYRQFGEVVIFFIINIYTEKYCRCVSYLLYLCETLTVDLVRY